MSEINSMGKNEAAAIFNREKFISRDFFLNNQKRSSKERCVLNCLVSCCTEIE